MAKDKTSGWRERFDEKFDNGEADEWENYMNGIKGFIAQELKQAVAEALDKVVRVVGTHNDGEDLGYCDTGGDMENACRSECVEMALRRISDIKKEYET